MLDLDKIKAAFQQQTILVIGDIMLDRYFDGTADRMSPEAPVPVLDHQKTMERLGGAANVALNIKSLGGTPLLCGYLGEDDTGSVIRSLLEKEKIDDQLVLKTTNRCTTVKTRVMAAGRHLLRIDKEDRHDLPKEEATKLLATIESCLSDHKIDAIIIQDYNKGLLTEPVIRGVIELANKAGIITSVDPKKKRFTSYQGVTLFKPNLKEVRESVFPNLKTEHESLEAAHQIIQTSIAPQYTMITLSKHGLYLADTNEGQVYPTTAIKVKDVCGAGDAVISVATMGLVAGLELSVVAELSNLAGGLVCEVSGVAPVKLW